MNPGRGGNGGRGGGNVNGAGMVPGMMMGGGMMVAAGGYGMVPYGPPHGGAGLLSGPAGGARGGVYNASNEQNRGPRTVRGRGGNAQAGEEKRVSVAVTVTLLLHVDVPTTILLKVSASRCSKIASRQCTLLD